MTSDDARNVDVGVIGGSGFYRLGLLDAPQERVMSTPFGPPSGPVVVGSLSGRRVAFVARHGPGHRWSPSQVPARANIYALRALGARALVSVSAVGSLREHLEPGHLVVPDQLVDRTRNGRPSSFFDRGPVVHVSLAEPYCRPLRHDLVGAATAVSPAERVHDGAVYCCVEGPAFSTRAESSSYRAAGMDVIGMTASPEAALAREAQLCHACLALVTDYDCWHDAAADVDADLVAEVMRRNVRTAGDVLAALVADLDTDRDCACRHALDRAVLGDVAAVPPGALARVEHLLPPVTTPPTPPRSRERTP